MIRKCKTCSKEVHVESKTATVVLCQECRNKKYGELKQDFDTDEIVFCRICNIAKKNLKRHINDDHDLTIEKYLEMFSGAPISRVKRQHSLESRLKMRESSKKVWESIEFREKRKEIIKNREPIHWKMSQEGIKHLKEGLNKSIKMQARRENKKLNEQKRIDEIRKNKEELKEFIVCPLCIREGKDEIDSRCEYLTFKHLQGHGYDFEKFRSEFSNFKFKIDSLCKEHSESLSGENHFNYGMKFSDELKQSIAEGVSATWGEHNETKSCLRCGRRIMERNEKDVCNSCLFKIYGFDDTYEYVYCRICFRINGNLTQHIVSDHNMTTEEYKNKYQCEIVSKHTKDGIGAHLLGIPVSEHHKNLMRVIEQKNNERKIVFEQNFKKEDYEFLFKRKMPIYVIDSYDFVYCRYCLRFMKHISSRHLFTHNLTVWMYHQLFIEAPIVARSVVNKVICKGVATKIKEGTLRTGRFGYAGYRKDIGHYTRSMIEANFCRILIYNDVKYEYEPVTFKLEHQLYSSYTPDIRLLQDFYVWKEGTFLELKNKEMDEDNEKKMNVFFDKYPATALVVLKKSSQEVLNLERQYKYKIKLWETNEQNIVNRPELY